MSDRDDILRFPSEDAEDAAVGARLASHYRALPARSPAEAERCAAAVLAEAARASRGWRAHVPRQRWWWGAAAAGLLVAVTMRPWRPDAATRDADSAFTSASESASAMTPSGSITPVNGGGVLRFDLTLPAGATDVSLVGDFNGWDERATPMLRRNGNGTWTAQVVLPPGRHVYAFVVDGGRWLVDPMAPQVPDAGFGPANAVVVDRSR